MSQKKRISSTDGWLPSICSSSATSSDLSKLPFLSLSQMLKSDCTLMPSLSRKSPSSRKRSSGVFPRRPSLAMLSGIAGTCTLCTNSWPSRSKERLAARLSDPRGRPLLRIGSRWGCSALETAAKRSSERFSDAAPIRTRWLASITTTSTAPQASFTQRVNSLWLTATRRRAPSTASPSARHSTVSSPPPAAPPGQRTRTNAAAAAPGTSHAKRSASSSSSPEGARWWGGAPGGRLPATGTEPLIEVATATPRTRLQPVPVESGVLRRGSIG
mmetsp:Transcript_35033/g.89609  ORF Transcript_35033/g.89609 Transcript_35033/m.89609 type:complete len:272 (+) Transcript_35033:68-883(+)